MSFVLNGKDVIIPAIFGLIENVFKNRTNQPG